MGDSKNPKREMTKERYHGLQKCDHSDDEEDDETDDDLMKPDPHFWDNMRITKGYKPPRPGRMTPGIPKHILAMYKAHLAAKNAAGSTTAANDHVDPESFDEVMGDVIKDSSHESTSKSKGKGKMTLSTKTSSKAGETEMHKTTVATGGDSLAPGNYDKEVDRHVKIISRPEKARTARPRGKRISAALVQDGTKDRPFVVDDHSDDNVLSTLAHSFQSTMKAASHQRRASDEGGGRIPVKNYKPSSCTASANETLVKDGRTYVYFWSLADVIQITKYAHAHGTVKTYLPALEEFCRCAFIEKDTWLETSSLKLGETWPSMDTLSDAMLGW
ncbi:hypothetical protein EUX98_g7330 [Antrodiella citrinella]|uniref:Uncharacterized protein n=1 Tax=Antrodiella citrinella TaxID=2447956 RepID=A0A4S4MMD2_9APHY|nr:hypothetical protein EUX98_g7330 [Antrodiella citrinella]